MHKILHGSKPVPLEEPKQLMKMQSASERDRMRRNKLLQTETAESDKLLDLYLARHRCVCVNLSV